MQSPLRSGPGERRNLTSRNCRFIRVSVVSVKPLVAFPHWRVFPPNSHVLFDWQTSVRATRPGQKEVKGKDGSCWTSKLTRHRWENIILCQPKEQTEKASLKEKDIFFKHRALQWEYTFHSKGCIFRRGRNQRNYFEIMVLGTEVGNKDDPVWGWTGNCWAGDLAKAPFV